MTATRGAMLLACVTLLFGCSKDEASDSGSPSCALDGTFWRGPTPSCTPEQMANDIYGTCSPPTMGFRACEYRRMVADQVFGGTYEAGDTPGSFVLDGGREVATWTADEQTLSGPGGVTYQRSISEWILW